MHASEEKAAIEAQAHIHHALLLGLQLMVCSQYSRQYVEEWMFRLFRRQHEEKFLTSFDKLGLSGLPDAVACARYHVLSNNIGGVGVEYMYESDRKAWVRFRYPRWMYQGPTLCGVPLEVSRGFLNGWYAHNGVSLGNPQLGFVCVSEDMTGEFGLCGYFNEYDRPLSSNERLQFAKNQLPPPFDPEQQPVPPADQWNPLRLAKASRNYALDFIRNGLIELASVIGEAACRELACRAARLTGLQYFKETACMVAAADGDLQDAMNYLSRMFSGMGDSVNSSVTGETFELRHTGLRIIRGLPEPTASLVFDCWVSLWQGTAASQRQLKSLQVQRQANQAHWTLTVRR
ncbi:MAG: hypothetical protein OXE78_11105 [Gammaproteobacteria bacterium]|nr:hypothetical protein [Gammaproteobacteria bacterium]